MLCITKYVYAYIRNICCCNLISIMQYYITRIYYKTFNKKIIVLGSEYFLHVTKAGLDTQTLDLTDE